MIVTTTINSFRAGHTDDFTWHTTKNGIPKINGLGKFVESNHLHTTTSQYTLKGVGSVKNSNYTAFNGDTHIISVPNQC